MTQSSKVTLLGSCRRVTPSVIPSSRKNQASKFVPSLFFVCLLIFVCMFVWSTSTPWLFPFSLVGSVVYRWMFFKLDAEVNHPRSLCCCGSYNYSVFLLKEAGRSTKRCLALRRVFGHVCDKNMYYWSVANIEASLGVISIAIRMLQTMGLAWEGKVGRSVDFCFAGDFVIYLVHCQHLTYWWRRICHGVTRTQGFTNGPGPGRVVPRSGRLQATFRSTQMHRPLLQLLEFHTSQLR